MLALITLATRERAPLILYNFSNSVFKMENKSQDYSQQEAREECGVDAQEPHLHPQLVHSRGHQHRQQCWGTKKLVFFTAIESIQSFISYPHVLVE
jgi:hypothetical protein